MTSEELALAMRKDTVQMIHNSHAAHIGAVLSVIDIVAVLYHDVMNYDCKNPKMETRDRLVLSKGHAGVAIYTALAECGFFDRSELKKYYTDGSVYSGHVSSKGVPEVSDMELVWRVVWQLRSNGMAAQAVSLQLSETVSVKKEKSGKWHCWQINRNWEILQSLLIITNGRL